MKTHVTRGFVVTLLLAAGCGGSSSAAAGGSAGRAGGAAGAPGAWPGGAGTAGGAGGAAGSAGTGIGSGLGGAAWLALPPVPAALVAPAGATVKVHAHAVGAQIYTCTASSGADGGAPSTAWVLKAPDAKLYDSAGAQLGTHGAGPSWTSSDGSMATGVKAAQVDAPLSDAIPWLLLRITSTSGTGAFSDITYVQRLSTAGGKAPATGCDATTTGMDLRVSYTAEYYLYSGGAGAAWLTPPPNVPDAIAIPGSVVLAFHDHAIGAQVYACAATAAGDGSTTYAWVFKAPDAILYDASFVQVGTHGAGPSWTSTDGSALVAKELAESASPLPDAIAWLLLKEFSVSGPPGLFTNVSIIQRLATAGGVAPPTGCDATTVSTEVRVPYSADYYFFKDFGSGGAAG